MPEKNNGINKLYLGVRFKSLLYFSLQTNKKEKIKKVDPERLSSNRFAGYLLEQGLPDLRVFSNIYGSAGFSRNSGKRLRFENSSGFHPSLRVCFRGMSRSRSRLGSRARPVSGESNIRGGRRLGGSVVGDAPNSC